MKIQESKVYTSEYLPVRRTFWVQWIALSSIGIILGWIVAWIIVPLIFGNYDTSKGILRVLFVATIGAITGASFGLLQWRALEGRISEAGWWIPASSLGLMGGLTIGSTIYLSLEETVQWYIGTTLIGTIIGALVGGLQWLILKQEFPQAGWYWLASTVGWTLGMAVKRGIFALLTPETQFIDFFLSGIMGGVMAGVITGGVLIWLLKCKPQNFE